MFQSYRNLSRHFKQYFYGDRVLEEQFTIALRHAYTLKFWANTPIHLHAGGGSRVLADQVDREVELAALNQHPLQLYIYDINNKRIQEEIEDETIRAGGEHTLEDQLKVFVDQKMKAEQEKVGAGNKVSQERFLQIYADALKKLKQAQRRPATDSNGEYTDFLEVRRPFISPNTESATH